MIASLPLLLALLAPPVAIDPAPTGGPPPNLYPARLSVALQQHLPLPAFAAGRNLVVEILLRIDAEGRLSDATIHRASGDDGFDAATLTTLKDHFGPGSKARLPLPADAKMHARVLDRGVVVRLLEPPPVTVAVPPALKAPATEREPEREPAKDKER